MSQTASINMINLQVQADDQVALDKATIDPATGETLYDLNKAADAKYYLWHGDLQTYPMGMDGKPEQFAQNLRAALPQVNTLRMAFNENSFDADGNLHPDFEAFLSAAAAEGFQFVFVYASRDVSEISNGMGNAEAYAALEAMHLEVAGAWDTMLTYLDAHQDVAEAVYGLEVMNEAAGYRHAAAANGTADGLSMDDFVALYTQHVSQIAAQIDARIDSKILVDLWGYAGDFETLATTMIDGQSALDMLRTAIGTDLVWSAHLYPGWNDSDEATTVEELEAYLDAQFAYLGGDDVIVTETNAVGTVDDASAGLTVGELFTRTYEWFAENGVGLGWFPGVETGASNFVVLDGNGTLRYLHQHSLAHGLNGYSLDEADAGLSGNDVLNVTLTAGRLRNESYQTAAGEALFDAAGFLGTAFGYAGDDGLIGTDTSNDMLYGGTGDDTLEGHAGDDFLYGQYDNDMLAGGDGIDHLYGGDGDDTLHGGAGDDQMTGGAGADLFLVEGGGADLVLDFDMGADLLDMRADFGEDAGAALAAATVADADGDGAADDVRFTLANGTSLGLVDVALSDLTAAHFLLSPAPLPEGGGVVDGSDGGDLIDPTFSDGEGDGAGDTADLVNAGAGDDTILTGSGNDTIYAGAGNDSITATTGNDVIEAGDGDDTVTSGKDNDLVDGGAGSDNLAGQGGADTLLGGAGNDTLLGGGQSDLLQGGAGDDVLDGGSGGDVLEGGDGFDSLQGANGNDRVDGGAEHDLVQGGSGSDLLLGGLGNDTVFGGGQTDILHGNDGDDSLNGGSSSDRLYGDDGNDTVEGGTGHDKAYGGAGHDLIDGGRGFDTLEGGAGDDVLIGGADVDRFVFARDHGNDTIADFTASERIQFSGTGLGFADLGFADAGADLVITSAEGTITLAGLAGIILGADDFIF